MQTDSFVEYMQFLGWQASKLGDKNRTIIYTKKLPGLGTIAKIPKILLPVPFDRIEQAIGDKNPFFVRLEPHILLPDNQADYRSLKDHFANAHYGKTWMACELQTIRVNIAKSEEALFASIPRENTRRNIRIGQKNGLEAEETDDLVTFYELHKDIAKRRHFYLPPFSEIEALYKPFKKNNAATIVMVYGKTGKPLVGVLLIMHAGVAYYRYVGSVPHAEDLRANSLAVWQAFLTAKQHGCIWFDFLGIDDPRHSTKSWQGFTQFKLGFSSNTVRFFEPQARYWGTKGNVLKLFDRYL